MIYYLSRNSIGFPPVENAEPDGFLAIGGDLRPERLLLAYKSGIFPWYSENSRISYQGSKILWWSPDPRFILFPEKLHVSKSMKKVLRSGKYTVTINTAFPQVISRCRHEVRVHQEGTWITDDMEKAYNRLHVLGYAVSVESGFYHFRWQTPRDRLPRDRLSGGNRAFEVVRRRIYPEKRIPENRRSCGRGGKSRFLRLKFDFCEIKSSYLMLITRFFDMFCVRKQ